MNTVPGGLVAKYESLGGLPPAFFGFAPAKTTGGASLLPPYTVIEHVRTVPQYSDDAGPTERTDVTVRVYDLTLAAAEETAWKVRYGGGAPADGAGFDRCAELPMTRRALVASGCVRTGERMYRDRETLNGQPVFVVELSYSVTTLTTG